MPCAISLHESAELLVKVLPKTCSKWVLEQLTLIACTRVTRTYVLCFPDAYPRLFVLFVCFPPKVLALRWSELAKTKLKARQSRQGGKKRFHESRAPGTVFFDTVKKSQK